MRELIKDFVTVCARTLPLTGPVYEFGALQVPGQEGFADLRPLFPGQPYVGTDMREGPGVDAVLDLHRISLPDHSVGTVLVMDTLEHVAFPHRALEEVHRVLRTDGAVVLSSVMRMRIHAYPNDYWRFTPEGFRVLLQPFAESFVSYAGSPKFPHTVVGVGFKGQSPEMGPFTAAMTQWQKQWEFADRPSVLEKWAGRLRRSSRKRWNALVHRA